MKQNQDQEKFNNIEETAKKIFGRDDEDYLADMDMAEQEWNELQERDKEAADQIRREQQKSLLAIQEELRARGSKPMTEEAYEQQQRIEQLEQQLAALKLEKEQAEEQKQEQPQQQEQPTVRETKRRCFSKKKALLMVAAVCVFVVGMTMVVIGVREDDIIIYPLPRKQNVVVMQNYPSVNAERLLRQAYERIEKEINIPVLMLSYYPNELEFETVIINKASGQLKFHYKTQTFYIREKKHIDASNSFELTASDRSSNSCQQIYNEWLEQNLTLESNELETGETEYSVKIYTEEAAYYVSGIMPKEEFVKIVEGLYYEK